MCEYCGSREVPAISDLMAEHRQLQDEVDHIRRALASGARSEVRSGCSTRSPTEDEPSFLDPAAG